MIFLLTLGLSEKLSQFRGTRLLLTSQEMRDMEHQWDVGLTRLIDRAVWNAVLIEAAGRAESSWVYCYAGLGSDGAEPS